MLSKEEYENYMKNIRDELKDKSKGFSMTDYNNQMSKFINCPDYETTVASRKGGEITFTPIHPVMEFRKWLGKNVLSPTGASKEDIDKFITEHEFDTNDYKPIMDFIHNFDMEYMKTGRRINFSDSEEADVTISLNEETNGENMYYILSKKSPSPKHLKIIED